DSGAYDVYARNSGGSAFSAPAQLRIVQPPSIVSAPPSVYGTNAGSNVTFTVVAGGTSPFGYQWRSNGTDIAGATTPSLSMTNLVLTQSALYSLAVSNAYGATTTSVTLMVLIRPVITNNPTAQVVLQGR